MTDVGEAPARIIFERPALLEPTVSHYCPGCGHGVVHRLVAEVLEELGVGGRTIAVAAVGCAVFAYDYLHVDFVEAEHGRAPAVASGIRRVSSQADVSRLVRSQRRRAMGTSPVGPCLSRRPGGRHPCGPDGWSWVAHRGQPPPRSPATDE